MFTCLNLKLNAAPAIHDFGNGNFFSLCSTLEATSSDSYCHINLNQSWIINYGILIFLVPCYILFSNYNTELAFIII